MLFRLIFPYVFLLFIVVFYLVFRYYKLGPVIMKVDRRFFSRTNNDSFFLIVILAIASYFLMRYEMDNLPFEADSFILGPYTYALFYLALMAAVIAREVERPALREKGISTSRGFWQWSEILSYRWSKEILYITISRGKRTKGEQIQVNPAVKKELDQLLKKMVPKRSGKGKKK